MNAFATPRRPAEQRRPVRPSRRRFAIALALESATLAVFAVLHLSGVLRIGADRSYGAGVAEALICVALLAGAVALYRWPDRGRRVALAALAFAIFGFFVGLSFTVGSGDAIDLVYHAVMLPVLMVTAALVALRPSM